VSRGIAAVVMLVALLVVPVPASAHVPVGGEAKADESASVALSERRPLALTAQTAPEPALEATPPAQCRPGSRPEPGMQGRLPKEEVDSGRAAPGYWCNLTQIGHTGSTGGFRVHRYIDTHGRECAYYDTTLLFPTNALSLSGELTGVAVLDMSDPTKPVRTDTLVTPAMQTPHESLNISVERGVLAAVLGNPSQAPGGIDLYDISQDCRHPQVKTAVFPATPYGHESGMAPDGQTFYPSSPGSSLSAVDISNLAAPRTLVTTDFTSHGLSVSDDGRRGYFATLDGLAIADLSEVQDRKPNPQIREISRLTWSTMTIPQIAIPVTIKGRAYVVEVDEYSSTESGEFTAHGPRVGAARIIDVSDETKPRVVSDIRLAVHQPENRAATAGDYGAQSPVQGYAGHYCNVPRRQEPGIMACSMIASGLRVFDIRDPEHPKEIAYFMSPPSTISATGGPVIDERSNWAMSQPAFAPERGEIWYTDGNSGFYTLKMDPAVWPFPDDAGQAGCTAQSGFQRVGVRRRGGGVRLRLQRRSDLPVRVDVFQVSAGRRVLGERRVAAFSARTGSFDWRKRLRTGVYFARFRMAQTGETRRVVFERTRSGRIRVRRAHHRPDVCGLVRNFKLERPVFGGRGDVPLRIAYRVVGDARVTVTVSHRGKVVKAFAPRAVGAGQTVRTSVPSGKLPRGDYRVRLVASGGEEQVAASVSAARL
jgi:hypothetical protein